MDYQWSKLKDFLQTNAQEVRERSYNNYNLRFYTQEEIEDITNGYCTILGEGGFGMVYKGILDDQRPVAVKRYKNETKKEDFAKEVTVHSQINHKNVVRLLGCCTEDNALMIVMEFISNGNLYHMLHCSNDATGLVPFPLEKRLDIAVESAEALSCMHSMYSPVLHGDIKPANILLDDNCLPKISDFGIARLLSTGEAQHTETVIGPIGYMDPLYINSGKLTPKSDVYSFGVVLLEIITRKKAVDGNTSLTQSFTEAFGKGKKVRHLFDEKISSGKKNTKLLEDIAKLAVECLRWNDKLRPEMIEVADRLRMIRKALPQHRGTNSAQPSAPPGSTGSNYVDPSRKIPPTPSIITLDKLKSVSKSLRLPDVLGYGPYTTFFLGTTCGNRCVIKKLDASLFEEFQDQVPIISKLKHENVVHVFGHFVEGNVHVLAYEYASMGSLQGLIRRRALTWKQRVKIALSAAKGLEFLHEKAEPPIIHSNIKSRNILIFDNDVAKIEYIGFSGQDPYASDYDPPEGFSMKSDIYSFGVVLLEILTGELADDCKLPVQRYGTLVRWAIPIIRKGNVEQCVDPALGGLYSLEAVAEMASIAALCVHDDAYFRPSMSRVVQDLISLSNNTSASRPSESPRHNTVEADGTDLPHFNSNSHGYSQKRYSYSYGDVIYVSTDGVASHTPPST